MRITAKGRGFDNALPFAYALHGEVHVQKVLPFFDFQLQDSPELEHSFIRYQYSVAISHPLRIPMSVCYAISIKMNDALRRLNSSVTFIWNPFFSIIL